ncbi:DUF3617 domain-containing protein [Ramlibacter sp. WS9]|uniref:DUF3617 domain-containing protein n=1 Tax=Ramlibacter sp. WS9 TaxID=1882741 RepID=UPI001144AB9B|nr:DUF3617 domain-containing protein [Ramlibacter sp. WS9]ROZ78690.1 DUF3617 domain-containing protein [Ramlibacter sp. WS9]
MKALHLLVAAGMVAFVGTANAQNLKPGLWEITNKMQTAGGQMEQQMADMQKQMAAMPPEQRKMMEEMMAQRGMKMGGGAGGGMAIKICLTKEMVEKNELPAQQGDCKTTQQSRTGNSMKMAFACTNPPSSGEGHVVFTSPEAYHSKMVITTAVQGKPEKITSEGNGKWLGADCGTIKPMMPPKK